MARNANGCHPTAPLTKFKKAKSWAEVMSIKLEKRINQLLANKQVLTNDLKKMKFDVQKRNQDSDRSRTIKNVEQLLAWIDLELLVEGSMLNDLLSKPFEEHSSTEDNHRMLDEHFNRYNMPLQAVAKIFLVKGQAYFNASMDKLKESYKPLETATDA